MTTATSRPATPGRPAPAGRRPQREASRIVLATSGWYDPDGAAWEVESSLQYETFRAVRTRPEIRVEGVGPDRDN